MIKTILHTPWTFMRWLRLAIGLYLVFVGITESEIFAGSIGALFTFLALLNQGCGGGNCSNGNCYIPKK
ncbi:hypothetical protein QYS49_27265 [Marivirga salinae]|uniref:DUF2892 domain-containing protein n=1 Tax=Marivirga salinarum TaxID=3059078 RepID=A0AA49J8K6_9BACT|nr:hypothetical protein [Marivirga sp. BDSF4-3]WKK75231.1 hypothetical protein QYS49_27265 [Marivirga sp. BDSF4-3]